MQAAPQQIGEQKLFTLQNKKGTRVVITNYGAIITSFKVKMPDGSDNDIVLGFDTIETYQSAGYLKTYPYFGAAIGRYGNRIKNGTITIDGKTYQLTRNMGSDQLHGGFNGFDKKIWQLIALDETRQLLQLSCQSPDGEEGYPGNVTAAIAFELTEEDELVYTYTAVTDAPTAINLTHHSYFNLNNGSGTILDHEVKIHADYFLEQDSNLVVTGNRLPVAGTKYDFGKFHKIGERLSLNDGYDQSFELNKKPGELVLAAEAIAAQSGLHLQVFTTDPVVHLYTGHGIPSIPGKNGITYGPFSGFCLETQVHPNAINIPAFPNTVLRPGEHYYQQTVYKISHSPEK
jgi:aldose 1-epimerase